MAIVCLVILSQVSCSVLSRRVRSDALQDVSFERLMANPEAYKGETVILGGYILLTTVEDTETTLIVLQTPLGYRMEPESRNMAQGRLMITDTTGLDPQAYRRNRKVTVAGIVEGIAEEKVGEATRRYLKIKSREMYLWPEYAFGPAYYDDRAYPSNWRTYDQDSHPYWRMR
jgi:outer membrane lipoprotein